MMIHKYCALVPVLLLTLGSTSMAGVIQFSVDNSGGTLIGNTYTRSFSGLNSEGVSFDVDITIEGFRSDANMVASLTNTSAGIGVSGGPTELLNAEEYLRLSLTASNIFGGDLTIDGWSGFKFNFFDVSSDAGVLSSDAPVNPSNLLVAPLGDDPAFAPIPGVAFLSAFDTSASPASFRVDEVHVSFTGVPTVPEPGTFAVFGLLAGSVGLTRRRR